MNQEQSSKDSRPFDLLCDFNNPAEEEYFSIKRDIYIESEPSLRNDPSPNPNKPFRLTREIYQNYVTLIRSIRNLHHFLTNYRFVLSNAQKKKMLMSGNLTPEDSQKLKAQLEQESLPLIINKIGLQKQRQEKQAISYAINKLKSMVLKARYKETTALEYLTETYITKLKNALVYHIRYRDDKPERNKLLELETVKNEFVNEALTMIKKKYDVLELKRLYLYKVQPAAYLMALRRGIISERPIFFINFFTESLLFISEDYISFNQNLLFCPIVRLEGHSVKISDDYLNILSLTINQWDKFQLYAEVYHLDTSQTVPIFYSKMKSLTSTHLNADKALPQRIIRQIERLQQLLESIEAIRRCVFGKMILHWLQVIFNKENHAIELNIHNRFKVVIRGSTAVPAYELNNASQLRPEILTNIILVGGDRKNVQKGRKQLQECLRSQIEATVFKLIADKAGTRVTWPLQCSSTGHYYYEYTYDRSASRSEVRKFYHQF